MVCSHLADTESAMKPELNMVISLIDKIIGWKKETGLKMERVDGDPLEPKCHVVSIVLDRDCHWFAYLANSFILQLLLFLLFKFFKISAEEEVRF